MSATFKNEGKSMRLEKMGDSICGTFLDQAKSTSQEPEGRRSKRTFKSGTVGQLMA